MADFTFAQSNDQHDSFALRMYYSDLYLALSQYELEEVPFKQKYVKVKHNDSLLKLARRNRISGLDSFHLAAALYEANAQAFSNGDLTHLSVGSTIKMPSIGDIFYSQERYEKLKVAENGLDFNGRENQMRNGLRRPFGQSLLAIGPSARDELPGNQVVTLSSSRPDINSLVLGESQAASELLKHASRTAVKEQPVSARKLVVDTRSLVSSEIKPVAVLMPPSMSDKALLADTEIAPVEKLRTDKELLAKTDPAKVVVLESFAEQGLVARVPEKADTITNLEAKSDPVLVIKDKVSQDRVISGAASTTTQDSDQNKNVGLSGAKIAAALPVAGPAISRNTLASKNDDAGKKAYLGPSRNSATSSVGVSSDPLSSTVEWKFDGVTTVGTVVEQLAEYVGYELTSTDETVLNTYTRRLPAMHRSVSGITAEEGFLMLGGRGLETAFDHVTRSVKHVPRRSIPADPMIDTVEISTILEKFVQASGTSSMLQQFPADILSATERHATRCGSSASTRQPDAARLYQVVIDRLQQKTPEPVARNLVDWYESPTGRKVLKLEKQQIDDDAFQQFSVQESRADRVQQIYDNTVTGRGIAKIAVELDYAGWSLSGCKQQAESSGDLQKMNQEMVHGQGIKKKMSKLEAILREDMLDSLAYQFSSLSERELSEYADIIVAYSGVYSELEQSIIDAIGVETKIETLSSLE